MEKEQTSRITDFRFKFYETLTFHELFNKTIFLLMPQIYPI